MRDWRETLEAVLALGTEHLSLYQLKIEEGTVFGQWLETGRIAEFDDEIALEMYELGHRLLEAQGYQQYEISNYAQPGKASLHNQAYWLTEDYYGLGLGGSFVSQAQPLFQSDSAQGLSVTLRSGPSAAKGAGDAH